jgi:ribonuclease HI
MSRRQPKSPDKLRIWQQNARKSKVAHEYILNTANPADWDVIAIQEPWIDALGNARGTRYWRVLYPSNHLRDGNSRPRSILLVNTNIATDSYISLNILNSDITAIRFQGDHGFLSIFNIYNDCTHNDNLTALSSYLSTSINIAKPGANDHMIWLGDFNRHHPLWEDHANQHLFSPDGFVQPLLNLLRDYDMELALPPNIPTLETSAGNWTRPDNVWCSHNAISPVITCDVNPSRRPPCADHLPIISILELPVARSSAPPLRNFREADFVKLNEALDTRLKRDSPAIHISTKEEFHDKVNLLMDIIQQTVAEHVPETKPCPYTKRWWTKELSDLKNAKNRLSNKAHKFRDIIDHPDKIKHKEAVNAFAETLEQTVKSHWVDWLENASTKDIYIANKYVTNEPSDYSSARVPSLNTKTPQGSPSTASTNIEKAAALAQSFFPPPPPASSVPPNTAYPPPLPGIKLFSRRRIRRAVRLLKPHKAPGPDGIPNVVLTKCIDALIDHLYFIFKAVLELDVYHDRWLQSITLVLRKIGKTTYDVAKSYHPIGLLDTIGKLLSTLVAADLSHLAEKHNMFPAMQFGGRPGRCTTDAMHVVAHKVKDAWRAGKVASALFLDVQGAFPNTVKDRLIHNMKMRRVPLCYIKLIERMLTNRQTQLRFDDFISDPIQINNGTTQGCPLSMLLYSFYNAPLIDSTQHNNEISLGFVDDSMFLAIADSIDEAHAMLCDMMERPKGGFDWSISHNSPFELSKLALMDFPRSPQDRASTNLTITRRNTDNSTTTQTVNAVTSYKYLGVLFDPKLRWTAHCAKVIASATWWSFQIARLARSSGGMPPSRVRQLYNTVAVPAFTYAADVWYMGIHKPADSSKNRGSVAVTNRLVSVQRRVAKLITGSLSSTAGDVMDAHANLLPVDILFHKILFRAATHIASLPTTHPLHRLSRKAASHYVKRHKSPLHNLFFTTKVLPIKVETITATRRRPNYVPSFSINIQDDKTLALVDATLYHMVAPVSVYSDGSGFEGGVGASAVLFINNTESKVLRYHLGSLKEHTVYEAEILGLTLSFHLLHSLKRQLLNPVVLGTDSQVTLKALDNQRSQAGHHLLDRVHDAAEALQVQQDSLRSTAARAEARRQGTNWKGKRRGVIDVQLHWTPAHMGFGPNERADKEAKLAAQGDSSRPDLLPAFLRRKPLPSSISALRQENLASLRKRWKRRWKSSPRYSRLKEIDKDLPSKNFLRLVNDLDRRQSSIIAQLRTGHIPLNQHLFRIRRSEAPTCPHCQGLIVETVRHFLFECPHYQHERHTLRQKLKRKADSLSFLLTKPEAVKPLLNYIHSTKRFKTQPISARRDPVLMRILLGPGH